VSNEESLDSKPFHPQTQQIIPLTTVPPNVADSTDLHLQTKYSYNTFPPLAYRDDETDMPTDEASFSGKWRVGKNPQDFIKRFESKFKRHMAEGTMAFYNRLTLGNTAHKWYDATTWGEQANGDGGF